MWANIKKNSLALWNTCDPSYFRISRLNYVMDKNGQPTMMRVRVTKYKGRSITLADGTTIHKNDQLLKIHLHNIQVLQSIKDFDSDVRRAITVVKGVRDALPSVASYIERNPYAAQVKGLIGISMLYKSGEKLGFETHPLQNRYYKLFKQITHLPIHLLSGKKLSEEMPEPMYLFMSLRELNHRYLSKH